MAFSRALNLRLLTDRPQFLLQSANVVAALEPLDIAILLPETAVHETVTVLGAPPDLVLQLLCARRRLGEYLPDLVRGGADKSGRTGGLYDDVSQLTIARQTGDVTGEEPWGRRGGGEQKDTRGEEDGPCV